MRRKGYKVSIIGAGAVGSTLAMRIVESGLADVVLLDTVKNIALGKAIDISDAAPIVGHERYIKGTGDYEDIRGSDIVVVTAGLPRRPGMAREELALKNASIIKEVSSMIKFYAPSSIVIVVTNPLDAMTYLAYRTTGFKREKVFGMAGVLDGGRFIGLISDELKAARAGIETYILGSHGDTMVPLISHTRVRGKPLEGLLSKDRIEAIARRTRDRGAEIVSLLGTGSAYYSPSASALKMVKAVIDDTKETMVVSAYLEGEYGLDDISIGVPCKLGANGIEEIVELKLSDAEMGSFLRSVGVIKNSIKAL